ncbi:hypothetical protein V1517DRAFT_331784 [Lipomyces orientalis]|uniref:Uncharacterized protein n=1 Tax=Lipomyces orientalis TaxID=1233043 RepID=A0ACC3TG72_9ASCO
MSVPLSAHRTASSTMPSTSVTIISDDFSDGEFLEYTGSESGPASPSISTDAEGNFTPQNSEFWISASMIDVDNKDKDKDKDKQKDNSSERDEDHAVSDSNGCSYCPTALARSFASSGIYEQVVHKCGFTMKLTKSEAALLYAFAAYFCLNGPVGFRTKIRLKFECKEPLNFQYDREVSIREVLGMRITRLAFAEYVAAVKISLPKGIACPMTQKYGEYFPNFALTRTYVRTASSVIDNVQCHRKRTTPNRSAVASSKSSTADNKSPADVGMSQIVL